MITDGLVVGDTFKTRIVLKYTNITPASGKTAEIWLQGAGNVTAWNNGAYPSGGGGRRSLSGSGEIVFELTDRIVADHLKNDYWNLSFRTDWIASGSLQWKLAKAERGMFFTDWSPAPEDTISQINAVSSEIKQTADGITLLATKTELNSAKTDLQSGITAATNKANTAQNTADGAVTKANNAQSTANSNAQTISTHTAQISALNTGLQAKVSQSEFNTLSGRVTTAENNIIAKANELSSKITSVEGKIPTSIGGTNYITNISSNWQNKYVVISGANAGSFIQQDSSTRISPKKFIAVEAGKQYTISLKELTNVDYYFKVTMSTVAAYGVTNSMLNKDEWIYSDTYTFTAPANCKYVMISVGCDSGVTPDDLNAKFNIKIERGNVATDYSPSPEDYDSKLASAQSEIKQTTDAITASVSSVQTAASNAQSTANTAVSKADAAQAGVNTLDSTTVKSASLTINTDGIVMKAGKSTTDVANAIGSYFAVNQNAINLFSDKINVKGNMVVSGAITSDKIASKQINTSHLNGKIITADVISSSAVTADAIKAGAVTTDKMSANSINGDRIAAGTLDAAKIKAGSITASQIASGTITSAQIKAGTISAVNIAAGAITGDKIQANSIDVSKISGLDANYLQAKIETAMVDWLKGKTIVADNGATKIDLLSGYINFDSDTPAIRRVTPGIPTQFMKFLKSDNNSVTAIGSNRDGSESSMNDSFAGIKITSGDLIEQTEIISDQIYFFTGAANRQGWQMSTVSGGDHRQITLFPSGNPTKSNIYASDYFIRGSNGWVNLLDFIDYFNACLKHLQNHTGRYDIWKPFEI